ncbi:lytic transglycosylase domain-containing protein [Schauerella aestuarii]|uniref:lytic transglycosylase domain-containing protein n=1 Tax=Schauerella aestuarii TaxID=2511204 RepID=UPI001370BA01|nr:lytic transglycosylase domain-containing protein [Achromobacter aestuarii]MYZ42372.1 lytic transglycosylase domain-containing protein [Achromobacter aestuarii]
MTARIPTWRVALALLLGATILPVAHANDTYRYKDPFGRWRTMIVPTGMAKHYKAAQMRAAARLGTTDRCSACGAGGLVDSPEATAARMAQLQAHPGLAGFHNVIGQASKDSGVDRALISAVIAIESGFRKDARSPKGALGLMQLMPGTAVALINARDIQTALLDPATNVGAGARHLRRLLDQYPGRMDLALAAYNAGEGAVARYDGIPPYAETQAYVRNVTALYRSYVVLK